ncbi:MAG: cysteine desulfurase [Oscillospiraceae bacterium]|nr:cysteine desulfurase [Oscillospiraceae bacterium]
MPAYLDNAATTKPCEEAVKACTAAMTENYGNPSSLHKIGLNAELAVTDARKALAAALVCQPECITFTSGATEANNTLILGAAENYGKRRKKIVVSAVEHPSVEETMKLLEKNGFEVVRIKPQRDGSVDADEFISAVDYNTCLASCMYVNNETGAIMPVKRIFSQIKKKCPECITHCDAVQAFMKIPIKTADLNADLITVSGHKVHAPKGVGAMYIRKGIRIAPRMIGGGQEKGLRSGTESVPLISAFGAAVRTQLPTIGTANSNAEELCGRLRKKLSALDYITINSNAEEQCPFILNFSVSGIRSEIMLHFLESRNIYVSSGSACSKGGHSSVLTAMGIPDKTADSAIRVSFSRMSSCGEVEALVTAIQEGYLSLAKR